MTGRRRRLLLALGSGVGFAGERLAHAASAGVFPWVWLAFTADLALGHRAALGPWLLRSLAWWLGLALVTASAPQAFGAEVDRASALVAGALQASLLAPLLALGSWLGDRSSARWPRWRGKVASALAQLALFAVALPAVLLSINTHRTRGLMPLHDPASEWPSQPIAFEGHQRTPLAGLWFGHPKAQGAALLVHGLGADKGQFLGNLEALRRRGFHVMTFDQRNHGASGGVTTTLGKIEALDVELAWAELQRRAAGAPGPRVLLGVSMGGAAAQLAAPHLEGLDALVLDSTFASFDAVARRYLPVPAALEGALLALGGLAALPVTGQPLLSLRPVEAAPALPPRVRVLIFHAEGDPLIPYPEARRLEAAYGPRARLVTFAAAHHAHGHHHEPERYDAALLELVEGSGTGR